MFTWDDAYKTCDFDDDHFLTISRKVLRAESNYDARLCLGISLR